MIAMVQLRDGEMGHTAKGQQNYKHQFSLTHSNLLLLARITSLHNTHKMSMLSLLLSLRPSTSGGSNIDAIFSHDGKARKADLSCLLGLLLA